MRSPKVQFFSGPFFFAPFFLFSPAPFFARGKAAAIHYSMVSSAKANGVEPFGWLRACYAWLPYHCGGEASRHCATNEPVNSDELDYLLPDVWLQANPGSRWEIDDLRRRERESAEPGKRRARLRPKRH